MARPSRLKRGRLRPFPVVSSCVMYLLLHLCVLFSLGISQVRTRRPALVTQDRPSTSIESRDRSNAVMTRKKKERVQLRRERIVPRPQRTNFPEIRTGLRLQLTENPPNPMGSSPEPAAGETPRPQQQQQLDRPSPTVSPAVNDLESDRASYLDWNQKWHQEDVQEDQEGEALDSQSRLKNGIISSSQQVLHNLQHDDEVNIFPPSVTDDESSGNQTTHMPQSYSESSSPGKTSSNGESQKDDEANMQVVEEVSSLSHAFPFSSTEEVRELPADIILGSPTHHGVTISLLIKGHIDAAEVWTSLDSQKWTKTDSIGPLEPDEVHEITLEGMETNMRYKYLFHFEIDSMPYWTPEYSFHTQRSRSSEFTFAITADSHLGTESHCNPARWKQTLQNVYNDKPDFWISLGDDFRVSKIDGEATLEAIEEVVKTQFPYLSIVSKTAPFFFVPGNHEYKIGSFQDGTPDNVAIRTANTLVKYLPNPRPGSFYSGNTIQEKYIIQGGLLENWYSWEWGDALFVVLDDYWYSGNLGKASWDVTLGFEQFIWLQKTLESSNANFKLVFHHHVSGSSRGGVEKTKYFEWGGHSTGANGEDTWAFDEKRPGWGGLSIHEILVENGVSIVFQGHDHLFTKQDHIDGIVYVTCPMPGYDPDEFWGGDQDNSLSFEAPNSKLLAPSGHLRVKVAESEIEVRYILSKIEADSPVNGSNGDIAYSFVVHTKK